MIVVMIVPTGIGAEIGGHAGDATPAAKLLASCCDTSITHPNVLNASDINEMPENCLYVEGSMLDQFLQGGTLRLVRQNKILLAVNAPVSLDTINTVSAARVTLGADIEIVELQHSLKMQAGYDLAGQAQGVLWGAGDLIKQVQALSFDALAIQSHIACDQKLGERYLRAGGINPWGGVEAILSKEVSRALGVPVAHAPLHTAAFDDIKIEADPRMAAEFVSVSYLHCVLKGLHKAPQLKGPIRQGRGIWTTDVDALVSAHGCIGPPHIACVNKKIPVIVVRENKTILDLEDDRFVYVENYHEAAGYLMCMRAGILPSSVRRPIISTKVMK